MSSELIRTESKKGDRTPIAKVRITWTDPFIDLSIQTQENENNRVSYPIQAADLITETPKKWFSINGPDPVINASYFPAPSNYQEALRYQVGWRGAVSADVAGGFAIPPELYIAFNPRPVTGFVLAGDSATGQYPVDFTVKVQNKVGGNYTDLETITYTDNAQVLLSDTFTQSYSNAERLILTITKWSVADAVVKIAEFYDSIVREYGPDDILQLSILEETDGDTGTLPIGNISCNEMDLTLQNIDNDYFPFNQDSELYTTTKKNRRIEPSVGFKIGGTDYLVPKGLYWSGDWNVSQQDTGAQVSARDRMELLRLVTYTGFSTDEDTPAEATYWENASVKTILDDVLEFLRDNYMPDLFWDIDTELDSNIIPLAFFKRKSYFDVVKELSQVGFAFSYFDTPTDAELTGNPILKDMLRVKYFKNILPEVVVVNLETDYVFTQDDYIRSNQPANTQEVKNTAIIEKKTFAIDPDSSLPKENTDDRYTYTIENEESIREYGILEFNYPNTDLLQVEALIEDIGESVVSIYDEANKNIEVEAFGDPTLKIGDQVIFPQFVDDEGYGMLGMFVLKRIQTEYDGTLRVNYGGFKLEDGSNLDRFQNTSNTAGIDQVQNTSNTLGIDQNQGV